MRVSIRDALSGVFAFRAGGAVVVFRVYLDDSNTHANSDAVLWAGFVGYDAWWDEQEEAWQAILNRAGLRSFSMAECEAGEGPYGNRASRDALTHDLRKTILDTPLMGIGVAADPVAWGRASPKLRDWTGTPAELCATMCMDMAVEALQLMAGPEGSQLMPMAFFLDKGAESAGRQEMMAKVLNAIHNRADAISLIAVKDSPALQACDMLAWELKAHARSILKDNAMLIPRPHFRPFIDSKRVMFRSLDAKSIAALETDPVISGAFFPSKQS